MAAQKEYNIDMIRDFFEHLLLEVRVAHAETTPHATKLNLEVVNQRRQFADRYGTSLLPTVRFEAADMPPDRYDAACEAIRRSLEHRYAEWHRCLEGIHDLLGDALECAATDVPCERVIDVPQLAGNLEDD